MGGSSGGGTQRTEPPKYQLPYLQYGTQEARSLYDRQRADPNSVNAPKNGATIDALRGTEAMARAGNPITGAAGNYATQTLNGGFMGSNPFLQSGPNPYLDQTFNQAALATQNQLASQFAGSGRNVGASEGLRAQQLGDLATNIYGGAYENDQNRRLSAYQNERGLQQSTLGMSPGLAQDQYSDLNRLLGVGQTNEGYQQKNLDAQGNALDQYMGRVSGNMGTTIKTDQSRNVAGGALGGAMLGSYFMPGMGTLAGGVLGGLFG